MSTPLIFFSKLITYLIHFLLISLTLVFAHVFLIFPLNLHLLIIEPTSKEFHEIQGGCLLTTEAWKLGMNQKWLVAKWVKLR